MQENKDTVENMSGIPDIDIIDLEPSENAENEPVSDTAEPIASPDDTEDTTVEESPRKFKLNLHLTLLLCILLMFVVCVVLIVSKFTNWGVLIDKDEIFKDGQGTYVDNWDNILPLQDDNGKIIPLKTSDGLNILVLGNAPFADDRSSKDSLAAILAESTDATIYNCALGNSYLSSERPSYDHGIITDAVSLYWMSITLSPGGTRIYYEEAMDKWGENVPTEVKEVYNTICSIDIDSIDVVLLLYDATDYLMSHPLDNTDEISRDPIQSVTTCLDASLTVLEDAFPNARIIVSSPPYAFSDQLDENGEYISSDIYLYRDQKLSMYSIMMGMICGEHYVSFIDNLYGTFNEDEAKDYLLDNLHLNVEGRKKIAQRIESALFYYGQN